ncbi:MAG: hypothetical protein CFE26_10120 [Verrucomicrobiales bacterium VVV1]|nr:MAG: hypothetical protein CFE26_10120 [Verrucomicrobiales bacterium VVV1]
MTSLRLSALFIPALSLSCFAQPFGFASLDAYGQKGTSGGGGLQPVIVHNAAELQREVERLDLKDKSARDQSPRVIPHAGA